MRRILPILLLACGCSGGGSGTSTSAPRPGSPGLAERAVSGATPFAPGCGGSGGTLYVGAEVEPHLVADPRDPNHLVATWQQDRWSNASARGLVVAVSFDGGTTWSAHPMPFTLCAGGDAAQGTGFLRASDPWVSIGADGTVHAIGLSSTGTLFASGTTSAILASRSTDGGRTWSDPATLIRDVGGLFDDKETLTADPNDARFVYAAWDRIDAQSHGPAYFARSVDGGATWEPARAIYDPGPGQQTLGNLVRVLPDGTLVDLFARLSGGEDQAASGTIAAIRSTDHGLTWSAPVQVAALTPLGARDPQNGKPVRDGSDLAQMAVAPDGSLAAVWQDGRFSGTHDAIAISRSTDGGRTWSPPLLVNADASVTAFTPQVAVRADGTLGVTYFTLRPERPSAQALPADRRLAVSVDAEHWTETAASAVFDLATAPSVGGAYFLGDYMGLEGAGTDFLSLHARTTGAADDPTDVFLTRLPAAAAKSAQYAAQPAPVAARGADFARRVAENLARTRAFRRERWGTPSPAHPPAP